MSKSRNCPWEKTNNFQSPAEFEKFKRWVCEFVLIGDASVVPTDESYNLGCLFGGEWFRWNETDEIWRLLSPDFPFRGLFEKVDYLALEKWRAEFPRAN